ncbi:Alanine-tRNA ligase [Smittium culicis]|uniref:Alanine--tRNA ligase n=1 Tax=Smittium culicis TaxID=133412 RepID=A0A1R1X9Z8_9FUNG|nr:Alanine-tRNA ligase [Smittium culicis]
MLLFLNSVLKGDNESRRIWENVIGLDPSKILQLPESDNFWSMGTNEGPCGSCTEIFWNMQRKDIPENHEDQWIELWNVVFMNKRLNADKSISELETTCIDTGMGLERLASVLQKVNSNFETDEFSYLINGIKATLNSMNSTSRIKESSEKKIIEHYRIIADHIRSCSLLISQGVFPSNTGRGYVLRRIIRRAIRSAYQLGSTEGLLAKLYPFVESTLGKVYSSLTENKDTIIRTLSSEESLFFNTLEKGLFHLEKEIQSLTTNELSVDFVFELYDTHGLPPDLTQIIISERGLSFNMQKFEEKLESVKEKSRKTWTAGNIDNKSESSSISEFFESCKNKDLKSKFSGYELFSCSAERTNINDLTDTARKNFDNFSYQDCKVQAVKELEDGNLCVVIDPCPFYGFGGGQPCDKGLVFIKGYPESRFNVKTVSPISGELSAVILEPILYDSINENKNTKIKVGDLLVCKVNYIERRLVSTHHTATHLLQAALRKVLGNHVVQSGSSISTDRFRFDFANPSKLSDEQIQSVENLVNEWAILDYPIFTHLTTIDDAKNKDKALGEFSATYDKLTKVRVVSVGGGKINVNNDTKESSNSKNEECSSAPRISTELCAGTHLNSTFGVFPFIILSECSTGSGTRRIEAMAGISSTKHLIDSSSVLKKVKDMIATFNKKKKIELVNPKNVELKQILSSKSLEYPTEINSNVDELFSVCGDISKSLKSKLDSDLVVENLLSINGKIVEDVLVLDKSRSLDLGYLYGNSSQIMGVTTSIHLMPSISNTQAFDTIDKNTPSSRIIPSWSSERAVYLSNKYPQRIIITIQDDNLVLKVGSDVALNNLGAKSVLARDLIKKVFALVGGKGGGNSILAKGKLNFALNPNDAQSINSFLESLSKLIY